MELTAIVKKYNLTLTRSESNLVDRLSGATSEQSEQRMKALAEARDVLKQLPDRQSSERSRRMEKAAMLKERLKMLKQMLPFLSPTAAKSLKSEMKQIAGQIASLSGGSGGGGSSAIVTMDAPAAGTAKPAQGAETEQSAEPTPEADQGDGKSQQERNASSNVELPGQGVKKDVAIEDERKLREAVAELKSLFKTVLEALKRKQGTSQASRGGSQLRAYMALPDSGGTVAVNV
ncbi:MAG: hypothetical protein A2076_03235 [Geobacteraceae bacterium GWC2_53_11]|nr:MAG: hypothetical protein A2076_03235 [Geobacteraceae bacterium GWC2_53_11]